MALFTDTVTVYNYRYDSTNDTEIWVKHIIKGVQFKKVNTVTTGDKKQTETNGYKVTFDFKEGYGNALYLPEKDAKIINAVNFWTLGVADQMDLVVFGEVTEEVTDDTPLEYIKDKYEGGYVVSVTDNRNRTYLKNIKVLLK